MTSLDKKKRQLQEYSTQAEEKEKIMQGAKIAGQRRSRDLKSQGMDIEKIKADEKLKEFAAKTTGYENKQEEEDLIALAESKGNEDFFSEIGLLDEGKESSPEEKKTKSKGKDEQDSYRE